MLVEYPSICHPAAIAESVPDVKEAGGESSATYLVVKRQAIHPSDCLQGFQSLWSARGRSSNLEAQSLALAVSFPEIEPLEYFVRLSSRCALAVMNMCRQHIL